MRQRHAGQAKMKSLPYVIVMAFSFVWISIACNSVSHTENKENVVLKRYARKKTNKRVPAELQNLFLCKKPLSYERLTETKLLSMIDEALMLIKSHNLSSHHEPIHNEPLYRKVIVWLRTQPCVKKVFYPGSTVLLVTDPPQIRLQVELITNGNKLKRIPVYIPISYEYQRPKIEL